jgi:hypothetical protein
MEVDARSSSCTRRGQPVRYVLLAVCSRYEARSRDMDEQVESAARDGDDVVSGAGGGEDRGSEQGGSDSGCLLGRLSFRLLLLS